MTYQIERRVRNGAWKSTKHTKVATSANQALRQFGLKDALASRRVRVARSQKNPHVSFRAVPFTG